MRRMFNNKKLSASTALSDARYNIEMRGASKVPVEY